MQPQRKIPPAARRRFLLGAGAAGAAGAAAVVATRSGVSVPQVEQSARQDGAGYQMTAHVRNYYRTTLI
jgi:hypothetical protein